MIYSLSMTSLGKPDITPLWKFSFDILEKEKRKARDSGITIHITYTWLHKGLKIKTVVCEVSYHL